MGATTQATRRTKIALEIAVGAAKKGGNVLFLAHSHEYAMSLCRTVRESQKSYMLHTSTADTLMFPGGGWLKFDYPHSLMRRYAGTRPLDVVIDNAVWDHALPLWNERDRQDFLMFVEMHR